MHRREKPNPTSFQTLHRARAPSLTVFIDSPPERGRGGAAKGEGAGRASTRPSREGFAGERASLAGSEGRARLEVRGE